MIGKLKESEALSYRRRHRGLIGVKSKMPIKDLSVLSRIYTPGVGAPCRAIDKNPPLSFDYTCRGNTIALITDGSQVYGLGNIGGQAALPKLEAKAVGQTAMETGFARRKIEPERIARHTREFIYDERLSLI